jgi:hypothetical protein
VVDVAFDRPDGPGDFYMILPTISGREPGLWLTPYFPNDPRTVPINPDLFTSLAVLYAYPQVFLDFSGILDVNGQAAAHFAVPPGRMFTGQTVTFCGLTFSATDFSAIKEITNSVSLRLQ